VSVAADGQTALRFEVFSLPAVKAVIQMTISDFPIKSLRDVSHDVAHVHLHIQFGEIDRKEHQGLPGRGSF
jgi:hypothetical protein